MPNHSDLHSPNFYLPFLLCFSLILWRLFPNQLSLLFLHLLSVLNLEHLVFPRLKRLINHFYRTPPPPAPNGTIPSDINLRTAAPAEQHTDAEAKVRGSAASPNDIASSKPLPSIPENESDTPAPPNTPNTTADAARALIEAEKFLRRAAAASRRAARTANEQNYASNSEILGGFTYFTGQPVLMLAEGVKI